jgi:hypothetical protein
MQVAVFEQDDATLAMPVFQFFPSLQTQYYEGY